MLPPEVTEKLESLPAQPGVYLFKDKKGEVVYVGKAKSLRSRVRSYFQAGASDTRYFIPLLHRTIGDLDTIVTGSEKEAMILESTLIKDHKPRWNVKLRDDKEYLSLRLDQRHAWPRLDVVRRPAQDGARYFGPYHSATAARRTLHLINKHFQLRTCSDAELEARRRPCLQYQIKRCPAPCVYPVDRAWYGEQVRAVELFLAGRHDELSRDLEARMRECARSMRFELAAVYRDQLRAIEKVREEQRVVSADRVDRDVLGFYREGELVELALLHVRAGKLADVDTFSLKHAEIPDDEIVAAFLAQHYAGSGEGAAAPGEPGGEEPAFVPLPEEILLPAEPEGVRGIAEVLAERAGHKVSLIVPKRGARAELLALAMDNARHAFGEKRRAQDDVGERLRQMQERLRLPTLPRRIECCDISHLGGGDTVGAVVAMRDGALDKKRYRTFHVRGTGGPSRAATPADEASDGAKVAAGGDDYAAMYEVLARRFRRGLGELAGGGASARRRGEMAAARSAAPALGAELLLDAAPATRVADGGAALEPAEALVPIEVEAIELEVDDAPTADGDDVSPAVAVAAAPRGEGGPTSSRDADEAGDEDGKDDRWSLPDLFVVDGGRGQLAVALAAAHDLGLHDLPVVGLAKERETALGETMVDRVYLPGQKNPVPLKSNSAALFFLARLRDEAHRVSNRAREKLGKGRRLRSGLDDVPGLGPQTRKALLTHLGSLAALRAADDAAILAVPGVSARHLRALRAVFPAPRPAAAAAEAEASPPAPTGGPGAANPTST